MDKVSQNTAEKTVILVDDDIDFLEQTKFYLNQMGFKVITAETLAEGQQLIYENSYDLAIFDLILDTPDSGFTLSYKSKKKYPEIPVILVTSVANETGLRFSEFNNKHNPWIKADIILDKNLRLEELKKEIDKLVV